MSELDLSAFGLSEHDRPLLDRYGFDAAAFGRLRGDLARGAFPTSRNELTDAVEPPLDSDLVRLPDVHSERGVRALELGKAALSRGEVAVAILNGGMATRFGGVVKGVVEVLPGRSFLALKLGDVARAQSAGPIFLMNSFATEPETRTHLEGQRAYGLGERLQQVAQHVSVRLTPEGEVFRDAAGYASLYAPGHGDLFDALASSEAFRDFARRSGRPLVMVSNVDNLGATLSPLVIGAHLLAEAKVTVEVAARAKGDKGGAPARRRGRVEVLEGFRFPPGFDIESIPVFNTNTMIMDASAVRADYPLTWFRADKSVDGRPAVQFERLMGEVTSFCDAQYLVVPREGDDGRFLPVKTPADLETLAPLFRARFGA